MSTQLSEIFALLDGNTKEGIQRVVELSNQFAPEYEWLAQYAKAKLKLFDIQYQSWYELMLAVTKYGATHIKIPKVPEKITDEVIYLNLSVNEVQVNVANEFHYLMVSRDIHIPDLIDEVETLNMHSMSKPAILHSRDFLIDLYKIVGPKKK